jgi:FYVE/RhoGEF/PH domain-containing protein 5/6
MPGKFQFNRAFKLTEIAVQGSKADPRGLEVLSSEKSFVAMAESVADQAAWLQALADAIKADRLAKGLTPDPKIAAACLFVQDSEATECFICRQRFTVMRRKHHCHKCGNVVCDKCSTSRITMNQQKKPQRACDSCVKGGQVSACSV